MHTFFHGWRRKAGVFALAVAMVLTGGWIRSRTVNDEYQFWTRHETSAVLASEKVRLVLGKLWNATPAVVVGPYLAIDRERIIFFWGGGDAACRRSRHRVTLATRAHADYVAGLL